MKKQLILIRHAQTENSSIDDFSRRLTEKGIYDARKIGKYLEINALNFELIFTSSAVRALSTARLIAEQTHYPISKIEAFDDLYFSSSDKLMRFINQLSDELNVIVLVNHNPTATLFVELLVGYTIPMMLPASLAILDFNTEHWGDISEHTATLSSFINPDDI